MYKLLREGNHKNALPTPSCQLCKVVGSNTRRTEAALGSSGYQPQRQRCTDIPHRSNLLLLPPWLKSIYRPTWPKKGVAVSPSTHLTVRDGWPLFPSSLWALEVARLISILSLSCIRPPATTTGGQAECIWMLCGLAFSFISDTLKIETLDLEPFSTWGRRRQTMEAWVSRD